MGCRRLVVLAYLCQRAVPSSSCLSIGVFLASAGVGAQLHPLFPLFAHANRPQQTTKIHQEMEPENITTKLAAMQRCVCPACVPHSPQPSFRAWVTRPHKQETRRCPPHSMPAPPPRKSPQQTLLVDTHVIWQRGLGFVFNQWLFQPSGHDRGAGRSP